jgi:hypothetical protein
MDRAKEPLDEWRQNVSPYESACGEIRLEPQGGGAIVQ